jgi:hypothetical protein
MQIAALVTGIVGGIFASIGAQFLLLAAAFRTVARTRHAASTSTAERTLAALRAAQAERAQQVHELEGGPTPAAPPKR